VTFPVRLAAFRQAVVERELPVALVRQVALVHPGVVALEHPAGPVHLQRAVPVVVAAVARAAAAVEQTHSTR
jgi:hypothetical protein